MVNDRRLVALKAPETPSVAVEWAEASQRFAATIGKNIDVARAQPSNVMATDVASKDMKNLRACTVNVLE